MKNKREPVLTAASDSAVPDAGAKSSQPGLTPDYAAFLLFPGLARRMTAYFIDLAIVGLFGFMLLNLVLYTSSGSTFAASLASFGRGAGSYALFLLFTSFIYHVWMESQAKYRGTVGKLAMGLQVVDRQGLSLTTGQAIARAVARLAAVLTCGLLYLVAMRGGQGRSIHDRLSKTVVIVRNAGPVDVVHALKGRRGLSIMDWLCAAAAMYLFYKVSLRLSVSTLLHVLNG